MIKNEIELIQITNSFINNTQIRSRIGENDQSMVLVAVNMYKGNSSVCFIRKRRNYHSPVSLMMLLLPLLAVNGLTSKCYRGIPDTNIAGLQCFDGGTTNGCESLNSFLEFMFDFKDSTNRFNLLSSSSSSASAAAAAAAKPLSYKCNGGDTLFTQKNQGLSCQMNSLDEEDSYDPVKYFGCTECEFKYDPIDTIECFDLSCNDYMCKSKNDTTDEDTNATDATAADVIAGGSAAGNNNSGTTSTATTINVCYEWVQSIYYNVLRNKTDERLNPTASGKSTCRIYTQMKTITQYYQTSVSNIQQLQLLLKKELQSSDYGNAGGDKLNACEFFIDDNQCTSCSLCSNDIKEDEDDTASSSSTGIPLFSVDCSNVIGGDEGGITTNTSRIVTTCEDMISSGNEIFTKIGKSIFLLEEGYTAPKRPNIDSGAAATTTTATAAVISTTFTFVWMTLLLAA